MNPRQRRGALLMGLAVLGSLGVFFAVLSFVADVNARVGNMTTVVTLTEEVPAYQPIDPAVLELREVPERWVPEGAVTDARDVVGLVSTNDLPSGVYAQAGMFVNRPGVQRGFREVAILVDAETGVAGKVSSGDRVDIIATSELDEVAESRQARLWVSNALVIDVGVPEDVESQDEGGGFSEGQAVPVTFALPVDQALQLAYVESFAIEVRLALRGGGDGTAVPEEERTFSATLLPPPEEVAP